MILRKTVSRGYAHLAYSVKKLKILFVGFKYGGCLKMVDLRF